MQHERSSDPIIAEMLTTLHGIQNTLMDVKVEIVEIKSEQVLIRELQESQDRRLEKTDTSLSSHMFNEEKLLKDNTDASLRVVQELSEVKSAFVQDARGNPDYLAHKEEHQARKTVSDWFRKKFDAASGKFIEVAFTAVVLWLLYLVWEGIKEGAKR